MIEERLQRAMAAGELPASLDPRSVASYYVTVQQGMSIQARDGASRSALEAIARAAMAAWDGSSCRAALQPDPPLTSRSG